MDFYLLEDAIKLFRHFAARLRRDRCLQMAAALSYTTLLSLVPLLTIGFAILTAFPVFEDIQIQVQTFLFENFVPQTGLAVHEQLLAFAENARKLSGIGIVILAVTAVMLLATIEASFNNIWRGGKPRPLVQRFLAYWGIITLGPLLAGASFSLTGYFAALARWEEDGALSGGLAIAANGLPFLMELLALLLIYIVTPRVSVRWRHALAGAVLAAILIEVVKKAFVLYLSFFPTYQMIYGALAAIPIFLVWMYVTWALVLLGAEVAAFLGERDSAFETDWDRTY